MLCYMLMMGIVDLNYKYGFDYYGGDSFLFQYLVIGGAKIGFAPNTPQGTSSILKVFSSNVTCHFHLSITPNENNYLCMYVCMYGQW
jgi:hypothetical protein